MAAPLKLLKVIYWNWLYKILFLCRLCLEHIYPKDKDIVELVYVRNSQRKHLFYNKHPGGFPINIMDNFPLT